VPREPSYINKHPSRVAGVFVDYLAFAAPFTITAQSVTRLAQSLPKRRQSLSCSGDVVSFCDLHGQAIYHQGSVVCL